jgi:hypothetical protein
MGQCIDCSVIKLLSCAMSNRFSPKSNLFRMRLLSLTYCLLAFSGLFAQSPEKPRLGQEINIKVKGDQIMYDATACVDGGILAVGETESMNGSGRNAWLVKIDKSGKIKFREAFGTAKMDDRATAVAELPNGLIVTGGVSETKSGDSSSKEMKAWLRCRDPKGNKVWDRELGESSSIQIEDIVVNHAANQIIVIGIRLGQLWFMVTDFSGAKVLEPKLQDKLLDNLPILSAKILLSEGMLFLYGTADLGEKQEAYLLKMDTKGRIIKLLIFGDYDITQTGQIGRLDAEWLLLPCSLRKGKIYSDLACIRVDTSLDKTLARFESVEGYRDRHAIEVQSFAPGQYYLFGHATANSADASNHNFCIATLNSEGLFANDKKNELSNFGTRFEETAVRCIKTSDGSLWLCGNTATGFNLKSQSDFWFGRLDNKATAPSDDAPEEPLQPLVIAFSEQAEGISLMPGENASYTITLHNPNKRPTGPLTLRSTLVSPVFGLLLTPEVTLPEIPAGGSVSIPIPLRAESEAVSARSSISINLRNTRGTNLGDAAFPVVVKALKISLAEHNAKGTAVKGQPCVVRAVFENTGSLEGHDLNLLWTVPAGVSFSGDYLQVVPKLAVGEKFETSVTVVPSSDFGGNQLEIKAFWSENGSAYTTSIPMKISLSNADQVAVPSATSTAKTTGSAAEDLDIYIYWKGDETVENTAFEQKYVITVGIRSKKEFTRENIKVILNGDTISIHSGQKFDEGVLSPPQKQGKYFTQNYPLDINLKPGRNQIEVLVTDGKSVAKTDIPWKVNYKPNDKGTLYVVSVGIPDKSGRIKYSQNDARDFARLMQSQQGRFYGNVDITTMTSEDATEARDISGKVGELLQENRRNTFADKDAVILFVSGHGFYDEDDGQFRIQGSDYDVNNKKMTTVSFDDIVADLDKLSCQKFVLADACQIVSGDLAMSGRKGNNDEEDYSAALEKILNGSKQVRSMTSCGKGESSFEDAKWENGAFTDALVELLSNRSKCVGLDKDGDKGLSLSEIFQEIQLDVSQKVKATKHGAKQNPSMGKFQQSADRDVPFFFY